MRPWGLSLARQGFTAILADLPGHGGSLDRMPDDREILTDGLREVVQELVSRRLVAARDLPNLSDQWATVVPGLEPDLPPPAEFSGGGAHGPPAGGGGAPWPNPGPPEHPRTAVPPSPRCCGVGRHRIQPLA